MENKLNGFATEPVTFPPFVRRGVTTGLIVPVGATAKDVMEVAVKQGSYFREKRGEATTTKFVVKLPGDKWSSAFTRQGLEQSLTTTE